MAECKVNLKDSLIDKSPIQKLNHRLVITHLIFSFSTQQLPRVIVYRLDISIFAE